MLYEFVKTRLATDNNPSYGTLGLITYQQGRVLRQLSFFDEAGEKFTGSCQHYYDRSNKQKDTEEDRTFCIWKAGLCLGLGLGISNYTRGYLTRALQCVIPARTMLLGRGGKINHAYVDLIYASIRRAFAGEKRRAMSIEAVEVLKNCYETFSNNPRYRSRAAFELALAFFYLGDLNNSERSVSEVEAYSRGMEDFKWIAKSLILQSRILQKRGTSEFLQESSRKAEEAYKYSLGNDQTLCEALLCKGEIQLELGCFEEAETSYQKALDIIKGRKNPKIEGSCYLHLANLNIRRKNFIEAKQYFSEWKKLSHEVEHGFVRETAAKIDYELKELNRAFVIDSSDDLNYKHHIKTLQQWLVRQAIAREESPDLSMIARTIGISRKTLYEWLKELKN